MATDHEISHGRDITWTLRAKQKQTPEHIREAWIVTSWSMELMATASRAGKPFQANLHACFKQRTSRCDTSLHTTPEALLQLARDRWRIESWRWIPDTQLHADAHRYRGNGAGAMTSLRTAALKLLRLTGFQSIRAGMHDITALLAMTMRQPSPDSGIPFNPALHWAGSRLVVSSYIDGLVDQARPMHVVA